MQELAYVNGAFVPLDKAVVSIEDRGFQFGDSVYEVICAYDGRLPLIQEHIQRIRRSAAGIALEYDFDRVAIDAIISEGLLRTGLRDALIYVQLTRGVAPRAHLIPQNPTPTLVMTFKPRPRLAESSRERGVAVMTVPEIRWSLCYIKANTLLPNVLAHTEARRRGFHDAVFVTVDGEVREATCANVFIVREGQVFTPARTEHVLHGIMQDVVMRCGRIIGRPVTEAPLHIDELRAADEVFLTNAVSEVLGVVEVDGEPVGAGVPGPVTAELGAAFRAYLRGGIDELPIAVRNAS